jgi:homoserine kinase
VGDGGDAARAEALLAATDDRLHQPYRAPAARPSAELVARLRSDGLPAVVSGAGPTVLVLARGQLDVERVSAATPPDWRCVPLSVDLTGAHVVAGPDPHGQQDEHPSIMH